MIARLSENKRRLYRRNKTAGSRRSKRRKRGVLAEAEDRTDSMIKAAFTTDAKAKMYWIKMTEDVIHGLKYTKRTRDRC